MYTLVKILSIISCLGCISLCFAAATMIVSYFSLRWVNKWVLWSIIVAIVSAIAKDLIQLEIRIDIKYPILFITGILFTILIGYKCYRKETGLGEKDG